MPRKFVKNDVLSKLTNVVNQYPLLEKILIVPDRTTGHHILENLTRAGTPWINFHVKTVTLLAQELVDECLITENLQAISSIGSQALLDSVFNELADSGKLKYFEKHPVNKGIIEALTRTMQELRLNGITSNDLKKSCFIDPLKEADMRLILTEYENALEEQRLVDSARLIMMALEQLKQVAAKGDNKFFILSRYYMRGIERDFIEKLCGKDLIVIQEDPAIGFPLPPDAWSSGENVKAGECDFDIERLRWLFKNDEAPEPFKDKTIELFSAIGCRNEAREVIRRIVAEKTAVDDVEIIYTDAESYSDLFYSLCEKLNIPATFSEGQNAFMTASGRAMMGFLLWVKEDFNEIYLRPLLEESTLSFLLRTSGVGWGRERYTAVLDGEIIKSRQEADDLRKEGEVDDAQRKEKKAQNLAALKGKCEDLLRLVPPKDKDGKMDFAKLCDGCVTFLEKHVKKSGKNDPAFVATAVGRLAMLGELIKGPMLFEEAMEKIFNIVSDIRVGACGPKPGHLHVSHYRHGGRSSRGRTFIVGLDEGKFPAKAGQDPVLLDMERERISDGLELSADRMSKNIYDMAALMAGLRGIVTFSYSAYNIKDERRSFPSSILLQIFRIKEGKPDADYETMLNSIGEPVGFDENPAGKTILDETDWWLTRLIKDGVLKDGLDAVQSTHEGIKEGLIARKMRASDVLTEYDGKIKPCADELDPRLNADVILSCTKLEAAAKCPFAYFVANVLRVRKPDEVEKDAGAWLDAASRGKLLHEVFQLFISKSMEQKTKYSAEEETRGIKKILEEVISRYKTLVPPPGEIVFQNECLQLNRDVGVFLQINRELGTVSVGVEVAFGDKKEDLVKIDLGDGRGISLRGKIDRIDKTGPSEYAIWDYKTGGTYSYEEKGYISGGEQIQHALYAVAAEEILKKNGQDRNAKVSAAGYLFPTEKGTKDGQGGMFRRPVDGNDRWRKALNTLLDLMAAGTFIVNEKDKCKFCDYTDICGGKTAHEAVENKLKNDDNKALDGWKTLKACG